ncbi:tRNA (guanosine(37)-N1)-methyltransferase TrmD [Nesterenkonia alba]|uniref:tRNA (guanosine(37)-N1)-methyltransferase TrmD n=1 Tax=Nesterenkonia alba TaxID=515814 RepID=UPI0003B5E141|nr:tRNA (guanosine(37)-N1)-methyltransferase TrmD [Nesterenkonia alba]
MRIDVISIFPEFFDVLDLSLIGRAQAEGLLRIHRHNLRDYTEDKHRTVDSPPAGGGAGMVMKPEPWAQALEQVLSDGPDQPGAAASLPRGAASEPGTSWVSPSRTAASLPGSSWVSPPGTAASHPGAAAPTLVIPTPSGEVFTQRTAEELSTCEHLVFAPGRFEGIDERVTEWAEQRFRVRRLSIGDYVLNGGEAAVVVMVEAITRLIPGVIGNAESLTEESHSDGLLEYPVYTKPADWRGHRIPEVLLSGDHGRIAAWRRAQAEERTRRVRPDLWAQRPGTGVADHDDAK